jgi:hypothetical protein
MEEDLAQKLNEAQRSGVFTIARIWSGFIGFEYLLSQGFFDTFSMLLTIAGVSGLVAGFFSGNHANTSVAANMVVVLFCVIAVISICVWMVDDLTESRERNYFGLLIHFSFLIALLVVWRYRIYRLNGSGA